MSFFHKNLSSIRRLRGFLYACERLAHHPGGASPIQSYLLFDLRNHGYNWEQTFKNAGFQSCQWLAIGITETFSYLQTDINPSFCVTRYAPETAPMMNTRHYPKFLNAKAQRAQRRAKNK